MRAVRRHVAAGARGPGLEQQQHAGAAFEEHEQAIFPAVELQPQHLAIKALGGVEIVDVEDGLEDPIDRAHRRLLQAVPSV